MSWLQPAAGAAPQKRGWFGRKNKGPLANSAATTEPTAPGTPAATAGAPGTGPTTATGALPIPHRQLLWELYNFMMNVYLQLMLAEATALPNAPSVPA